MKTSIERTMIDEKVVEMIESKLTEFGVPAEKAYECYDAIRFQVEARAVLLNRVQDRKMTAEVEFYGAFLRDVALKLGCEYDPDQPV